VAEASGERADRIERDVHALFDRGDHAGAVTAALRGYGPELYGFLRAIHRDEAEADESFAELAETLWRRMPAFQWQSTMRTWAYAVARNVMRTRVRNARRRARRAVTARTSALQDLVQGIRTETSPFLRTEKRTRLQALRDALPEEDRMLLVLKVDRRLEWNDVARVLMDQEGDIEATSLAREAARLRKRFQLVKGRLREQAKREGLVQG
jgi:RNA polymerase sigma-70 factor (ECF subfamily)